MLLASYLLTTLIPMQSIDQEKELHQNSPEGDALIYLIRHGESTSNIVDPEVGLQLTSGKSLNIALTEKGKKQAALLGAKLASKISPDSEIVICSSAALRAQQTAQEIFKVLSQNFVCELDTTPYEGLCELGQGSWEGLPKDEAYKADLGKWEKFSPYDKVFQPKVSTGESYSDVVKRFFPAFEAIVQKHSRKFKLVVSHHAALNAATLHWNVAVEELSKDPHAKLLSVPLGNCDIISVKVPAQGSVQDAKALVHYRVFEKR